MDALWLLGVVGNWVLPLENPLASLGVGRPLSLSVLGVRTDGGVAPQNFGKKGVRVGKFMDFFGRKLDPTEVQCRLCRRLFREEGGVTTYRGSMKHFECDGCRKAADELGAKLKMEQQEKEKGLTKEKDPVTTLRLSVIDFFIIEAALLDAYKQAREGRLYIEKEHSILSPVQMVDIFATKEKIVRESDALRDVIKEVV